MLGDTIYGRVMVDSVQNLGNSFVCNIEKVFLCTGADGYVPKYNPAKFEFGCLADSSSLLYRYKILVSTVVYWGLFFFFTLKNYQRDIFNHLFCHQDKAQPETQARVFGNVSFNAVLAVDDPAAMSLVRQSSSDGFRLDSTAMFQVSYFLLFLFVIDQVQL